MKIELPLCACGCGEQVGRAKTGPNRGEPNKFVHGHNSRVNPTNWNGGQFTDADGYVHVLRPDHPRADSIGYVREHILVAEEAMGKPLPEGALIHHVNQDPSDNRPENLVVCPDDAYHMLLHARQRALDAAGDPDYLLCHFCSKYGDPDCMYVTDVGGARPRGTHPECDLADQRKRRRERRH